VRGYLCVRRSLLTHHFSGLHDTVLRSAISLLKMPAMSPTMTEGAIAQWKKKEGDAFTAGDILLEIVSRYCPVSRINLCQ
jgi:hypothetical protein